MAGSRAFILSIRGCIALISFLLGSPMIFPMNCMVFILLLPGQAVADMGLWYIYIYWAAFRWLTINISSNSSPPAVVRKGVCCGPGKPAACQARSKQTRAAAGGKESGI